MTAIILGQPTAFVVDTSSEVSCISRSLAESLDRRGDCISVPVNADLGQGAVTCLVDLVVVERLPADLVLGANWSAYYREYLIAKGLLSQRSGHMEIEHMALPNNNSDNIMNKNDITKFQSSVNHVNLELVKRILLNPCSPLYTSVSDCEQLANSHGIIVNSATSQSSRLVLIHHIVNGLCACCRLLCCSGYYWC
ncbi:hypothetical protein L208DRAFT_1408200 [Tricholoma matsutake]|nr:hypothetical protein L208DRAFT_1408200 [Tricholoma matsutake 945]